jgi:hypothetical protein
MTFEEFMNYVKTIEFVIRQNRFTKLVNLVNSYVLPRAELLWLNGWTSTFRTLQGYHGDNAEVPLLLYLCRMR